MKIEMNKPKMVEDGIQLAPSILAADFARLGEQVAQAEEAGVAAGANVLVAGSAIFGADDGVAAAMKRLRAATKQQGTNLNKSDNLCA
jgi:pentose-5-phosphate-3-epimerase